MAPEPLSIERASSVCSTVLDRVTEAVIADRGVLETVLTGALARGHVLLEDVPGTGKTLTARALGEALGLGFKRIQFTPDLLPSDITGSPIYNEHDRAFEFVEGPVFANVVLADEINRAPPKTQAALLEAMDEHQVSVDGQTHRLPDPFFVMATQNPVEHEGTFELPEAQRDRFVVKTSLGYPDRAGELELIDRRAGRRTQVPTVERAVGIEDVRRLLQTPETVTVNDEMRDYLVSLCRRTREDPRVAIGVSPRGVQRFFEAARAHAVISSRDYVAPDDVKPIAGPVMAHRLVLTPEARVEEIKKHEVVKAVVSSVEVPSVVP